MIWKNKILDEIKKAKKLRAIDYKFANFLIDIAEGDTEFFLVYSSSKEKYYNFRFTQEIGLMTKRIILTKYGAQTWRNFKNN
jgi:hypothetical protein